MSTTILFASMLMALSPQPLDRAVSVQLAANDYYCSRTAGIAMRVADGEDDGDLADAARLVRKYAHQQLQQHVDQPQDDTQAAHALGDRLTQELIARYSRSGARAVLADALVDCAESL